VLDFFPDTAAVESGTLTIGGCAAPDLAAEFGTPLVVYCGETVRARASAFRTAVPDALVVFGTKAFPNVALLRLLAEEGIGADVSTLGELSFAARAGVPAERLVVHGNNKSDDELRAAVEMRARLVVLDSLEEVGRAADVGVDEALLRVTPGIEAETHEAIRTGHRGSKFGLAGDDALTAINQARESGLRLAGLHVHVGSDLRELTALRTTVEWLGSFAATCRERVGWTAEVVDLGGGLGAPTISGESVPSIQEYCAALTEAVATTWDVHHLSRPSLIFEPGRALLANAGLTLYTVGVVKRTTASLTYVAVDGGMSDNPRPQLYGARHTAMLANRAAEPTARRYAVCGKHCEAGDVLITEVDLPEPKRGDLLAVPATGAYTLGMASNYNGVPRPAAVLVRDGYARLIRRRETIDDLLGFET
jgi:diaminopimelate decarboxylase